jgi:hypothetical protein
LRSRSSFIVLLQASIKHILLLAAYYYSTSTRPFLHCTCSTLYQCTLLKGIMPDKAATATGKANNATGPTPPSSRVNFSTIVEEAPAADADTDAGAGAGEEEKPPLYKSNRLKGYMTLILAGVINYSAAVNSQKVANNRIAATDSQRAYAEAVAITSCLISGFVFLVHLDRWSPLKKAWHKAFGDGSIIELLILIFLVIWWTIATGVGTSVSGIAGDGKGQFNLYYSTWCCCWTSYWTLERWLVAYGWASFKAFISSWPFRAPGWIAICGSSFMCLMWYLDLFSNHTGATKESVFLRLHYAGISDGQWDWLLVCAALTLAPSFVFIAVELFRETTSDGNNDNNDDNNNNNNSSENRRFSIAVAASHAMDSPMRRSSRQLTPQRQNPLPDKGDTTGGKGPMENILEGCW